MKHLHTWIVLTAVVSSTATYLVTAGSAGPARAAAAPAEQAAQQPQSAKVIVDERDIRWNTVNAYRIHTTNEEVILDLGFNMLDPNVKPGDPQQLLFRVPERNVMSYSTAKRLQQSLTTLVQKYEAAFGPITAPTEKK